MGTHEKSTFGPLVEVGKHEVEADMVSTMMEPVIFVEFW